MRVDESATFPDGDADGLGPVLLKQQPKPLAADLFLILAVLFLIPSALMPFTTDFRTGVVAGPICAGLGALFGIFGIAYILTNAGKASYLHEQGLRVREGGGWRVVRYRDVTEMSFRVTRMYYNGAYTGTAQEMSLRTDETGARPVVFRHTYREGTGMLAGRGDATALNHLCDLLTGQIARRMDEEIRRGETVSWARGMGINDRGVEVAGRGGREEVEWDRVARVDVERGVFRLWVRGETKPRVQVTVGEPNFFPGYALVAQRLRGQPESGPAETGVTPAPAAAQPAVTPTPPELNGSFRVEYTPTVDDHAALSRWYHRATPEGRRAWAGRVWPLPLIVIAVGVLIGVINLCNKDLPEGNGAAAVVLLIGLLLRPLLGWILPMLDRAKLGRQLRAASDLARAGQGGDPFAPREVVLGPQGYWLRTSYGGEVRHAWQAVSRAEWFEGYIFVFLAADRVRRETTGLILPPRAFRGVRNAYDACERIQEWCQAAAAPSGAALDPQRS